MEEKIKVQMIWIDKGKNDLFNLSIKSWLYHGYEIDLYTNNMNMVDNDKVNHIDYKTILDIETDNTLHFADLFRYKLLYEKGGLYVDSDLVLINDYDFNKDKYIISSEHTMKSGAFKSINDCNPTITLLKFPPKHPFIEKLIDSIETKIVNDSDVCQFQKIFQKLIKTKKFNYLCSYIKQPKIFCGVPWWNAGEIYEDIGVYTIKYNVFGQTASTLLKYCTCIHLWNNFSYNKYEIDFKNPIDGSLYKTLVDKFIGEK